jgi:hypothetical protein
MSKIIATVIIIAGIGCSRHAPSIALGPSPSPVAQVVVPTRHLAPPGIFFLTNYRSITTSTGVIGFAAGTKVSLIRNDGKTMRVSDGRSEFDVPADELTNDLDIAARAASGDARAQEQIGRLIASQAIFVSILEATYGCPDRSFDVTAQVQARVARGEQRIQASNELAGDPAFGCPKTLTITYTVGGAGSRTESAREGGSIMLPAPAAQEAPSEIRRSPVPRRAPNPLDRGAYDQKENVARPPRFYNPKRGYPNRP